ncbi:MAG TPA: class I SAM-dependent rRNA methyltransferase [Gemmataceae bacterium]|nr:class I SAM-dependent rRNA methyltransferase [Gemmataceae bacterium]
MTARIILRPRRARPFFGHHPWVYAGAIADVIGEPADGEVVDLYSHAGNFVARGLYNSRSKIRVRLYTWSAEVALDAAFFRQRLERAFRLRHEVLGRAGPGRACRMVFSEGDGLSGLTVDQYDRWLVVQFTALGMAQRSDVLIPLLVELLQPEGIYLRTERGIGQLEGLELRDGPLWGQVPSEPVPIDEDGIRFLVHLGEGQKTGFYLDQHANRCAVSRFAAGRRVLDAFCYTGGFGLHAAKAGAQAVVGVDGSAAAVELAQANRRLNGFESLSFVHANVFDCLQALEGAGERFGLIVLDPPKFARARNAVEEALRGYRRLQSLALRLLESEAILVTCCCSGLITTLMLEDLLAQLAVEEGREIQILQRRGQASDHPVSVSCPETNYLKCLISRVT